MTLFIPLMPGAGDSAAGIYGVSKARAGSPGPQADPVAQTDRAADSLTVFINGQIRILIGRTTGPALIKLRGFRIFLDNATEIPYIFAHFMQTIAETSIFTKRAFQIGMSDSEVGNLISYLAGHPDAGDEIKGTGGCRKLRWAAKGKGKRGGVRVITFFSGNTIPVFLLTVYAKNEKSDLTASEAQELGKLTKQLVENYRKKAQPLIKT
jgi:hypothetical protein